MTVDFETFYRTHRTDAVRWASALVGDRAIGEDLAQEALIAVSRKMETLDNPVGYLRRTIVNMASSVHRRNARERVRMARSVAGAPTSYTAPTGETLDALDLLPHRQRAAVTLRYWADWTDDQIAAALGCAPATVRVLLHRGLATLREELSK